MNTSSSALRRNETLPTISAETTSDDENLGQITDEDAEIEVPTAELSDTSKSVVSSQLQFGQARKLTGQSIDSAIGVLGELPSLEAKFRDPRCSHCGQAAHVSITKEGIVSTCKRCTRIARVDTSTLQHIVDRLAGTCFSCKTGKLKSMARPFGNILKCQNPGCGRNNSWQDINERILQ